MNDRIKVVDSHCGSGKTSWAINYINSLPEDVHIIYITPFLAECDRIINSCKEKKFFQPKAEYGFGSKLVNLISLINQGRNVVSTHSLFSKITDELIEALRSNNYILFLDEVFDVVNKFQLYSGKEIKNDQNRDRMTKRDIEILLDKKFIEVEDDFTVKWVNEEETLGKYQSLKNLADRKLLYLVNNNLLLWSFPAQVFYPGIFDEIYILTYMFDYQLQAYYYNYFEIEYGTYHIEMINEKYEICKTTETTQDEIEWKRRIKELITIISHNKLNKIGGIYPDAYGRYIKTALSKTWYDNSQSNSIAIISKNVVNFFMCYTNNTKTSNWMWTCFKEYIPKLKSPNLPKKHFVELNCRATNIYGNKTALAYTINRYLDPFFDMFFSRRGIHINQDGYALSDFIQWIWRSAIRNGKPIILYVPSERMRTLLEQWLNNEEVVF
jgi:hypothetical protein